MATAPPTTREHVDLSWFRHHLGSLAGQAQASFIGGLLLSFLGFVLPWFRHGRSAQWWYSGWQLWRNEGLDWIVVLFVGYLALLLAGLFLLDRDVAGAASVLVLAIAVALGTLAVVAIGLGDALDGIRTMSRLNWGIGLPIMFLGHATMLVAGTVALVVRIVGELIRQH